MYKFSSTRLNTIVPHFFVCVTTKDNKVFLFTCCTSQFKKQQLYIERRNDIPNSTLVWIKAPNKLNDLYKDTYVNCNDNFMYSFDELGKLYEAGKISLEGKISEAEWQQIINGLLESPFTEDEIKELVQSLLDDY